MWGSFFPNSASYATLRLTAKYFVAMECFSMEKWVDSFGNIHFDSPISDFWGGHLLAYMAAWWTFLRRLVWIETTETDAIYKYLF